MKFTIVRNQFLEALKKVQNTVSNRGSLPILQNVLMEAGDNRLTLTTTDLDISIKTNVNCEVIEGGQSTMPVKLLVNSMLKAPDGNVEINVDDSDHATLRISSAQFRLNGLSADGFPQMAQGSECFSYVLPCHTFSEMLRKTSYASSQDDTRRALKGVLMSFKNSKITTVAIDGRRLALVENEIEVPAGAEKDIIIPQKTVQELMRALPSDGDLKIVIQDTLVCFDFGETKIFSKLIDETYPNYTQVIPEESPCRITVDRVMLLNALERASVMTIDDTHSIKLIFDANQLTVTSASSDYGDAKDEVPIKYLGEKIEIVFNPGYIIDPLKFLDDDEITIGIIDGHHPAVIRCSIPFLYVLMPLRIN